MNLPNHFVSSNPSEGLKDYLIQNPPGLWNVKTVRTHNHYDGQGWPGLWCGPLGDRIQYKFDGWEQERSKRRSVSEGARRGWGSVGDEVDTWRKSGRSLNTKGRGEPDKCTRERRLCEKEVEK